MKRLALLFLLLCSFASAQTSPFLPEDTYQKLVNEISGDNAYNLLRDLTKYHSPQGVDRDARRIEQYLIGKAKEAGLADLKYITMPSKEVPWSPIGGEAWLIETLPDGTKRETKLGSYREIAMVVADNSRPVDTEADLVDVGTGVTEADYAGKDVRGKIVLASGAPATVEKLAVWKHGALGILSHTSSRVFAMDYPDQIAWARVNSKPDPETKKEPAWAFVISPRRGQEIREKLTPKAISNQPGMGGVEGKASASTLRVRVKIESEILPEATQAIIEGWIRGKSIKNQQVVFTAHIQEELFSANDDRSGCANLIEMARALTTLIKQGRLPQPERDIRFWWVNEIDGPYTYFALNPDERKNIFVNINQDMVGTNQKMGHHSRVQHVSRTPWSRPTFFNDVVESIITALYQGNNAYINAKQVMGTVSSTDWYSRPIYSHMGSRDRYSVEIIPHMNNTDHMVFADAWVGTVHGGITFTNWPDDYIHSSEDDIWQMDPTTLKRNAVAVTALGWFMANASEKDIPAMQNAVITGALSRIQRDMRNVFAVRDSLEDESWELQNVYHHAKARELAAYKSLRTIQESSYWDLPANPGVSAITGVSYIVMGGKPGTGEARKKHPLEDAMSAKVAVPADIKTYRDKVSDLKAVAGLPPVMRYEALNFADGKRTLWEIFSAVRAESLATGEWYYGKITPDLINQLFTNAAAAGFITLKDAEVKKPTPVNKNDKKNR